MSIIRTLSLCHLYHRHQFDQLRYIVEYRISEKLLNTVSIHRCELLEIPVVSFLNNKSQTPREWYKT